jgi:hypothetical protein
VIVTTTGNGILRIHLHFSFSHCKHVTTLLGCSSRVAQDGGRLVHYRRRGCLRPQQVPRGAPRRKEEYVCRDSCRLHKLTNSSPPARCRQGRLQAVLEVPQRQYSQEVPEATAGGVARFKSCTTSSSGHLCKRGQEAHQGHRQARGELRCHCASANLRCSRGI